MDKFSDTDNEPRVASKRRAAIGSLAAASIGGLFGKLFGSTTAYAQDGAAVAAVIKAEATAWVAVYKEYAGIANGYLDKTRAAVEGVQTLQNARKIISDQDAANKNLMNGFWSFGKNPLGATLPMIHVESQPIFKALDKVAGYYDAAIASPATTAHEKEAIAGRSKLETQRSLGENDAIANRKNINALNVTVGGSKHSEKNVGEIFTAQAGPIIVEQNQAILECLLRMEQMMADTYGAQFGKLHPEKQPFGPKEKEKLLLNHKKGLGTLAPTDK